jgi:hypothetical protein
MPDLIQRRSPVQVDIQMPKGARMLFIGHFSFDEAGKRQQQRHGYFTCLIDAGDAEKAMAKFGEHILKMKKKEPPFQAMTAVYLEDLIQVARVPKDPIVTRIQSSEGAFPRSITHSLPAVFKNGIEAFGLPSNVDRHEQGEEGRYKVSDPFIRFD